MASPVEVSICIPARNEFFHDLDLLSHTVENVLANTSETCEVICVLDGYDSKWPPKPLPVNSRVTVIQHDKSIGQRAACNEAVRVARGKWIVKLDAHCAVGPQFDTLMAQHCDYLTTLIPVQYNLHAFSWACKQCKHEIYQGPKPAKCTKCGSRYSKIVVKWQPRGWKERNGVWSGNPKTTAWRFDSNLDFQYWGELGKRYPPEQKLTPTLSFLGACWMLHRERYWELGGMDEAAGSWGNQATELACKSWLSGGQVLVNHETWFAHLFRTQQGFGFPYANPGKALAVARSKELWLNNKWPKAKHSLSWLIEKFAPVPDWPNALAVAVKKPTACALYYTCNSHDETLELAARNNLRHCTNGHELGCVSLQRTDFGDWTVVLNREKSGATMHYQILAGLERSRADHVFLCESDVMYHPSHFEFTPPRDDTFYYNTNVWRVRYSDGHAVRTSNLQQVSGICANRELLLAHYRKRVALIEANGGTFDTRRMAYEPGTRGKFGDEQITNWQSPYPNLDITGHGQTLTTPHFSVESFRNKKHAEGWEETDGQIDGWPLIYGRVREWLKELADA
jgi:DNA-directed RNA polymerase subunit RPC12/RpoP